MPFEKMLVDGSLDNNSLIAIILFYIFAVEFISYCNPNNGIYYFKTLVKLLSGGAS